MSFRAPERIALEDLDERHLEVWLEAFKDYKRFAKPYTEEESKKDPTLDVALFLHLAGLEVRALAANLSHDGTLSDIVEAIRLYICPATNVVVERNKFFSLVQEPGEELAQFVVRLKRQASKCAFSDETVDTFDNQMIRDQLIKGLKTESVRVALLKEESLCLKTAERIAASMISAEEGCRSFDKNAPVFSVQRSAQSSSKPPVTRAKQTKSEIICWSCRKPGHVSKDCFRNHLCEKCNRIGHFEKYCRFLRQASARNQDRNKTVLTLSNFDGPDVYSELCFLDCELGNNSCKLLVDTGATVNLVSKSFIKANGLTDLLEPCHFTGKVANGSMIHFRSLLRANITHKSFSSQEFFYVADCLDFDGLLGLKSIRKMGFHLESPREALFTLQSPVTKFCDIFDKPLKDACLREIQPKPVVSLTPDAEPKQCKVRGIPKKDKKFCDSKIAELLEAGVIRKSLSPWRHQPLVVPKDGGEGKRLVIDYKPVNSVTVFDAFPLPDITSIFEQIGPAKFFSKIDFSQFYHQLPLLAEDMPKTAFHYDGELFEYTRCPFGLKNAVAYCFRVMREVLRDCKGVAIFLDDLCVYGQTKDEHDRNLEKVLQAIRKHGLSINSSKCDFYKEEISFLGFHFKDGVRRPDPKRYSALLEFPLPNDARQLQRFIGMCTFFSNFVPNYADLISPLYAKLKSFSPWKEEELFCFDELKRSIFSSSLHVPGPDETLVLYTDASDIAISGILVTGKGQPVQFCSRKLTAAEAKYDIVEREALAIYWSVNRCRTFLLGRPFVVFSDHKGLHFLFKNEKAAPKVLRWRLNLADYNFVVRYYRGSENLAADCFSRINTLSENSEIPVAIDSGHVKTAQKFCAETKVFIEALERNFAKRPAAVSPNLWSCRKDASFDGEFLRIDGKFFVPYALRRKCLLLAHGCHAGQDATYNRLKDTYFWPGMKNAVVDFVQTCRICSMARPRFYNPPMTPVLTQAPMQCLAADYIGPLPNSYGYKYCLVVIDVYSRFPFVIPVKSLKASDLCVSFKTIFSYCGFPDSILTDRGSNFESAEFYSFCKQRSIRKLRTTSYNPKGNGICERFNSTLKSKIFQILTAKSKQRSEWIHCIDEALFDYRTSIHTTTEFRPVDLFFSFNCRGSLPYRNCKEPKDAPQNMSKNRERAKRRYDRKVSTKATFFRKGEEAMLRLPFSSTFSAKVIRVRVLEDVSPETVKVLFPSGRSDVVNKSRLSRFAAGWELGGAGEPENVFRFPDAAPSASASPEPAEDDEDAEGMRRTEAHDAEETSLRRSARSRFPTLRYDDVDWRDPALLGRGACGTLAS